MRRPSKSLWLLAACGVLLSGCATYGYDDHYAYDDRYYDSDRYYERPYTYYEPRTYYYGPRVYAQPSIGFGFSYHRGYRRW